MTKARKLIDNGAFEPEIIKMMGEVLESAWTQIEPAFSKRGITTIESARKLLADAIFSSVAAGRVSPDFLREEAISIVKRNHPEYLIGAPASW